MKSGPGVLTYETGSLHSGLFEEDHYDPKVNYNSTLKEVDTLTWLNTSMLIASLNQALNVENI